MLTSVFHRKTVLGRLSVLLLAAALLLGLAISAGAEEYVNWDSLCAYGSPELAATKISTQTINGETCLVLPANVSPSAVYLRLEMDDSTAVLVKGSQDSVQLADAPLDLTALCGEGDSYTITLQAISGGGTSSMDVKILFSGNVSAMYLVSDDPVNKGRTWVEASPDKSNKATGSMVMQNADGTVVYDDALTQIKGRGNSTWNLKKRPYQIKLDSKTDLLQTGDKNNKSKTWVLLANYSDLSLMRNTFALDLGAAMGMESNIQSTYVDLYYDGEYRGCYLLTEKVEVGSGRVDITDLEEANEDANPDQELEDFSIATGTTANGASYTYCVGMQSPADIAGGYLLEMDASYRAVAEACYFWTTRNEYVVVKSPEFCSKEEMDYIASLYQEYEDALYSASGVNPTTGKDYTEYVDLKSTAQCYLINELAKNLDGFRTSAFLYKEAGQDMMTMGPLWDYDLGFGVGAGNDQNYELTKDPECLYTVRSIFGSELYKHGSFREAARDVWVNDLYPLLTDVVLGDTDAVNADGSLRSIAWYRELLADTAGLDFALWRGVTNSQQHWLNHVNSFKSFMTTRVSYLNSVIPQWNAETCDAISTFIDVEMDDWFCEVVFKAKDYGLMQGIGTTIEHYPMFDPDGSSTRAAVARVIYNMANPGAGNYENKFSDVPAGTWYTDAICWGAANGVINGYPEGTFRPDAEISREDLVTLLYRYSGQEAPADDILSGYTDASSISHYAREAMAWAISNGILQGYPEGTLRPENTTARAELAAILVRYYEKFVQPV